MNETTSTNYYDDLLNEMERGEISMDFDYTNLNEERSKEKSGSFFKLPLPLSKKKLRRNESDTSIDRSSASSAEFDSYIIEPDKDECFNWELTSYDNSYDDSKLEEYYKDYNPPQIFLNQEKSNLLTNDIKNISIPNYQMRNAKYHSLKTILKKNLSQEQRESNLSS